MTNEEKQKKASDFIEKIMQIFREEYGEGNPDVNFIMHITDKGESETVGAIGGHGCPMCALTELNVYVVLNNFKHAVEENNDAQALPFPMLEKSQMN